MKRRWPYWLSWVIFFAFAAAVSARMAENLLQAVINFVFIGGFPTLAALWVIQKKKDR